MSVVVRVQERWRAWCDEENRERPFLGTKKATSDLYFVECRTQLTETVGEATQFAARKVTLIYLSFTNWDIWIALPGGGVTLEGGTNGA
jgi:hypothetical protein